MQSTPPQVNNEQETEEIRRLQDQLTSTNMQLKQLDEANRAWQQYQQNQLVLLRDRLKLTDMENSSFEDIVQQIENRLNDLNDQVTELEDVKSKFFFLSLVINIIDFILQKSVLMNIQILVHNLARIINQEIHRQKNININKKA